jgi:hypothetical protein
MDMIPSDKNLGIGGMNHKGLQALPQEEIVKNPEKTEVGTQVQQGDKVELKVVLPKKEEASVKGFSQEKTATNYEQILTEMKHFIVNNGNHAVEAQAGTGSAFLKSLYS